MPKLSIPVHRITINDHELSAIISDLTTLSTIKSLHPDSKLFLSKLNILAIKKSTGIQKPAYVQTGRLNDIDKLEKLFGLDEDNEPKSAPVIKTVFGSVNEETIPSTATTVIVDRRASFPHYTTDQIEDAKFKAADYYITTGTHKDFTEFLPKHEPIEEERRSENLNTNADMSDNELFKSL